MNKVSINDILNSNSFLNKKVSVSGWVKTFRANRFIALNDGSCLGNLHYELRKCLKRIANQRSVSQAQVAINWCCYQGAIPLVGMRKKSQVIDVSNVFKWNLNGNEFKLLQEVSKNCLKKMPKNPFSSI